jgi:RNA polymerase sigma factor (sigma-70 family)
MNSLALQPNERGIPAPSIDSFAMNNETDASLITYMAFYAEETPLAESAATELYRRHSRKMTAWCIKSFWLCRQNHEELVQQTFIKALKGANSFASQLESVPEEKKTSSIKFWLYCILKNLGIDARRSEQNERNQRCEGGIDVIEDAQIVFCEPTNDVAAIPDSRRIGFIGDFIATLPTRDQAIMYNTMQFYDRQTRSTIMPKVILNELCAELGMTKTSLKTQRFRLLDRLRQYLVENE